MIPECDLIVNTIWYHACSLNEASPPCLAVSHVSDYACIYAVHNMFVHCVLSVNLNIHLVYANTQYHMLHSIYSHC